MQKIEEENWFYILENEEKTDEYFLDVLCGTVALYNIQIKLEESEIAEYKRDKKFIKDLATKIFQSPQDYLVRKIQ